ncbi:MAG: ATP-dependent helicase C-terminal domain-containing protein, partial [Pseudomonadota bacterium]
RALFSEQIETVPHASWSKRSSRVETLIEDRLGALTLASRRWADAPDDAVARAMLDGVRELGLPDHAPATRLRPRITLLREAGEDMPDVSDAALMETVAEWLLPHLTGIRTAAAWRAFDLRPALEAMLSWDQQQTLTRKAPAQFETPLGRKIAIDYDGEAPAIELRLQEMFGTTRHPVVAGRALRVTLLSPAGRPLQTTMDVPGFWDSSYADVRKDMRGRYPKHPWPEDPRVADPTLRAKRRGK